MEEWRTVVGIGFLEVSKEGYEIKEFGKLVPLVKSIYLGIFQIRCNGIRKTAKTLEEAIELRNKILG
jgi:choline kinase